MDFRITSVINPTIDYLLEQKDFENKNNELAGRVRSVKYIFSVPTNPFQREGPGIEREGRFEAKSSRQMFSCVRARLNGV